MWSSCSVVKQVVMVSVVRQVHLRFKRLNLWKQLAQRYKKGMPLKNVRFNVFSVMAMSLVLLRNQMTSVQVVSVLPSVNWLTVLKSIWTRCLLNTKVLMVLKLQSQNLKSVCQSLFVQMMWMPSSQPATRKISMQSLLRPLLKNQILS